ncbi:MAG: polyprenyl synthetase family protein [Peptococcaceae bacterium]|nr:polyprenyl synthetase family protein [Peptococcaceae bacterium]
MFKMLGQAYGMQKNLNKVEEFLNDFMTFNEPYISKSALEVLSSGGKRVRPTLVILTASAFGQEEKAIPLAAAMELIHMSSLIHDDIIDGADTRRGMPTLNVAHSRQYALHTGDYVLTKAVELVSEQPNGQRLLSVIADLSIEMSLGEIEQLRTMYDVEQTVEDYNYRIDRKTALLMATSCQAGALVAYAPEELADLYYQIGHNLGMAFQIKDDILDFETSAKKLGKPAGEDLARGIMTLPTILVLQKDFAEREWLINAIKQRFPGGRAEVNRAIEIIKEQNGLEAAHEYSLQYVAEAKKCIALLPEHPVQKTLLAGADYIIERSF